MKVAFLSDNYSENPSELDPFRFELLKEFASRSKRLLYIQASDFLTHQGQFRDGSSEERVIGALESFAPDMVFSLNRAGLNRSVTDALKCPVQSWYIDNPNRFDSRIRHFVRGERVFCATKYMMKWVRENANQEVDVAYLPFCTNPAVFFPKPAERDLCDISFVGTIWDTSYLNGIVSKLMDTEENKVWLARAFERYATDYDYKIEMEIAERLSAKTDLTHLKNAIDDFISTRARLSVLESLSDLNVEIYGTRSWGGAALMRSERLLSRFRAESLNTPGPLADLYRRSRICLSISHNQAQSGFPIRIFDILGVGSPLLTDRRSEIGELFEEDRMFLSYATADEAKEKALSILGDEARYQRMKGSAVDLVREKHTFKQRTDSIFDGFKVAHAADKRDIVVVSRRYNPTSLCEQVPNAKLDFELCDQAEKGSVSKSKTSWFRRRHRSDQSHFTPGYLVSRGFTGLQLHATAVMSLLAIGLLNLPLFRSAKARNESAQFVTHLLGRLGPPYMDSLRDVSCSLRNRLNIEFVGLVKTQETGAVAVKLAEENK